MAKGIRGWGKLVLSAALLGSLSACTLSQVALHTAKVFSREDEAARERSRVDTPRSRKTSTGAKIGRPYQINGVWYYPAEDPNYNETGLASWYGVPFHGRQTANGEIYDMNELTAAHKTLPLPSDVRVTNLENGRSIMLRVNDRGPFVHGRIIDVSRRASQLLGFHKQGVAKVRVEIVNGKKPGEFRMVKPVTDEKAKTALPAIPQGEIASDGLAPPEGAKQAAPVAAPEDGATTRVATATPRASGYGDSRDPQVLVQNRDVKSGVLFIQAGAFGNFQNALKVQARLSRLGQTRISRILVKGQDIYRVRLGPVEKVAAADEILEKVIAEGLNDARIIVD